ncbi:MAG: stage V sporulation T C-terminal domain-containing protein [Bacilli bacterium]
MKSTGVTRKIDELGRVVIPKEIRRNLEIRDGENLEIFIDNDSVILKKHYQMHSSEELSNKLCNMVSNIIDVSILISDQEKIISSSNNLINLINKKLDKKIIEFIDNREIYESNSLEKIKFNDVEIEGYYNIVPIISSTDSIGVVIIISKTKDNYIKYAEIISKILSEKIDIG